MATTKCELCGEPMPAGEEMFKFHGYSGPCPVPIPIKEGAQDVEWWLGEQGIPGVPLALTDGPHSDRAGVERALYLIRALGLGRPGRSFVCVEAVVTSIISR